jgi:N-acetylmuramoyl-L-alanine amidase
MKRKIPLVLAVALLISAPAWAARPFGQFGGKVGGGNGGAGMLPLYGWALDDDGVERVEILVDGFVDGKANYRRSRPQVTKKFPDFPDSALPGWVYQLDTTHYLNGVHTITARVLSKSGELVNLGSRRFQFGNLTHALDPFGQVEFPKHQAELRGHCLADPARRWSIVSGYALDTGVQVEDTGVGYVELLLDGAIFANSNRDCFRLDDFNLPVNCYGLRRHDLVPIFPHLKDAPHSGFRFAMDIGFLITGLGYSEGTHRLTIRAGDTFNQVSTVDEIFVTFSCDDLDPFDDEEALGDIEQPLDGNQYSGIMRIKGWALDWEGVQRVEVFVDGFNVGTAFYGHARPLITPVYPGYPDRAFPGWEHSFDTTQFSNGEHYLEVVVTDDLGQDTYIGRRRFVIANPRP